MRHTVVADELTPLVDRFAAVLADPLADPMVAEWVAVPSPDSRGWLALELARRLGTGGAGATDGVAANIAFHRPNDLLRTLVAADDAHRGATEGAVPTDDPDPWHPGSLMCTVLSVAAVDPDLAGRAGAPGGVATPSWAQRIADRFDRYQLWRPQMVRAWASGKDVDAHGAPLTRSQHWQPELWRAVRRVVATDSLPERLPELLEACVTGELPLELPERLSIFGFTNLPGGPGFLEVLDTLAVHREVHLFLLDPSPETSRVAAGSSGDLPTRRDDRRAVAADRSHHPLTAAWGRSSRETAFVVARAGREAAAPVDILSGGDLADDPPPSLLAALQRDIRANVRSDGSFRVAADDRSVQIHRCPGPARQVEVLRDALVHLCADDPTLTEEDVLVLCPDPERFGPYLRSILTVPLTTSDVGAADAPPTFRVSLVQGASDGDDVFAAFTHLLELVGSPVDAEALLAFCDLPVVADRFGLDPSSMEVIAGWVAAHHVRWGLDPVHRARFDVPGHIVSNTWQRAVDALLTGAAMTPGGGLTFGDVLPDVTATGATSTVGAFADLVARLSAMSGQSAVDRSVAEWIDVLLGWLDTLAGDDPGQLRGHEALTRRLTRMRARAAAAPVATEPVTVSYAAMIRHLVAGLGHHGRGVGSVRGGVTVAPMGAQRWVPHRVIAVLGLDERTLGSAADDGDDLTLVDPRVGDLDRRGDAWQSLLEAILAARDHLVITTTGTDLATGAAVPEPVLLGELRDALCAVVTPADRTEASDGRVGVIGVESTHPRSATAEMNFVPGTLDVPGPWGVDAVALAGARARREAATATDVFDLDAWTVAGADRSDEVDLTELLRFFKNPSKVYLEAGARITVVADDRESTRHLPVKLDGLEAWGLRSRVLDARLEGVDAQVFARAERAGDGLPIGPLGDDALTEADAWVSVLLEAAARHCPSGVVAAPFDVAVPLDGAGRLVGSLDVVADGGSTVLDLSVSRLKGQDRLAAAMKVMALQGTDPTRPWQVMTIRAEKSSGKGLVTKTIRTTVRDRSGVETVDVLSRFVRWYRLGLQSPIPYFPEVSPKLAVQVADGASSDVGPLTKHWHGYNGFSGDGDDAHVAHLYPQFTLHDVLAIPAVVGDPPGEGGRVQRYAAGVWSLVHAVCAFEECP